MTASINNVINVQLLASGALAAQDNMNVVAIMTSQADGPLNSANRYELYSNATDVATAFGSNSDAAAYANTFFGTQPNPLNAGGVLVMGYWRSASENVAASAAVLNGAQLSEAVVVPQLQLISDGTFDVDIDASTVNVTGLDFQAVTTLAGAVTVLDTAVTGGTVTLSTDNRIVITSDTTGVTSLITFATDPASGTYVGSLLAIASGTGATTTQGADASVLSLETKDAALDALLALVNYKGVTFIDQPTDGERATLAAWSQANSVLQYDTFSGAAYLAVDPTNAAWAIKLASQTNYRMTYSTANNRKLATSYMARNHTVNFNAENSAITMHLKELSVAAEDYSQTDIDAAKTVGLDIYTTIKDVPVVLTSGANDYVDNRYNLLSFIDAIQTDSFNLLKGTATKVPQTTPGVNALVDSNEQTTRRYVRAGVFAPGTWTSTDFFGDKDTFDRNIEQNGFYVLAGSLADQSPASRANRESPVIQVAVKNAGAIHSADIIINFNE